MDLICKAIFSVFRRLFQELLPDVCPGIKLARNWHKIGMDLALTGTGQVLKFGKISFIIMSSSSNQGKVGIIYHETFKVF